MKDFIVRIKDKIIESIRNHKEIAAVCILLAGIICFFLFNDFQSKEEYYNVVLNTVEESASDTKGETTLHQNKITLDTYSETTDVEKNTSNIEDSSDYMEKTEPPAVESEQGTEPEFTKPSETPEVTSANESIITAGETEQFSETDTQFQQTIAADWNTPDMETTEIIITTEQVKPEETVADTITVYISIDCMTILDHMEDLKDGDVLADYIGNGMILDKTGYQISAGCTVFDLLEMTARANRIPLDYQGESANIYSTVYVRGIQHIYEKSCGSSSGWMYTVNGEWAGVGCSSKKLKDGDFVQWRFSCDGGSDLRGN